MPEQAGQDGRNVLPALLGESDLGRRYIIQEALKQLAVRKGNWKYIPPGSVRERLGLNEWKQTIVEEPGLLFYLIEDPQEEMDLAARYPERVKELRAIIEQEAPGKGVGKKRIDKKQLGF